MKYNHGKRGQGKGIQFLREHIAYDKDECLIWPMSRDDKGYGHVGFEGKVWKASRLMCILAHGEPPSPRHHAAHSCGNGNRGCVSQKHLSWRTPSQNQRDAVQHGRYGFNSAGRTGKLNRKKVAAIRRLRGKLPNVKIGARYGVHAETIAKIFRGETWSTPQ